MRRSLTPLLKQGPADIYIYIYILMVVRGVSRIGVSRIRIAYRRIAYRVRIAYRARIAYQGVSRIMAYRRIVVRLISHER